jgi:hypothetical protein
MAEQGAVRQFVPCRRRTHALHPALGATYGERTGGEARGHGEA